MAYGIAREGVHEVVESSGISKGGEITREIFPREVILQQPPPCMWSCPHQADPLGFSQGVPMLPFSAITGLYIGLPGDGS